jgi:hypothetical protein
VGPGWELLREQTKEGDRSLLLVEGFLMIVEDFQLLEILSTR